MTFIQLLVSRGVQFRRAAGDPNELTFEVCPNPVCKKKWKFGINLTTNKSYCFVCHESSKRAVSHYMYLSQWKEELEADPLADYVHEKLNVPKIEIPKEYQTIASIRNDDAEMVKNARRYLLKRGITGQEILDYRMGFALSGQYANRIIIPVYFRTVLAGIEARDWTNRSKLKYLRNEGEKVLFNCPAAPKGGSKRLVIAEGAFKSIAIRRVRDYSTAVFGTSITPLQITQLQQQGWRKVLVLPDPGRAGVLGGMRITMSLEEEGIDAKMVYPIPEKQADDYTEDELAKVLRSSVHLDMASRLQISMFMLKTYGMIEHPTLKRQRDL